MNVHGSRIHHKGANDPDARPRGVGPPARPIVRGALGHRKVWYLLRWG